MVPGCHPYLGVNHRIDKADIKKEHKKCSFFKMKNDSSWQPFSSLGSG
jgi:hypothetical protein